MGNLLFVNPRIHAHGVQVAEQNERLLHVPAGPRHLFGVPREEVRQLLLPCQLHELEHQPQRRVDLVFIRVALGEVQQQMPKLWQVGQEHAGQRLGKLKHVFKAGGCRPAVRPLMQDEGQHWRQRQTCGLVLRQQNLQHIAQQA